MPAKLAPRLFGVGAIEADVERSGVGPRIRETNGRAGLASARKGFGYDNAIIALNDGLLRVIVPKRRRAWLWG